MNKDCLNKERREFRRIKNECVVMLKIAPSNKSSLKNKEFNAVMLDLGAGGMSILTHKRISKSTFATNKFVLISDTTFGIKKNIPYPIEAIGKVCYGLKRTKGKYRVGMRFTRISDDSLGLINRLKAKKTAGKGHRKLG